MGSAEPRLFIIVPSGARDEANTANQRSVVVADAKTAHSECDQARGDRVIDLSDGLPVELLRKVGYAMVLADARGGIQWTDPRFNEIPSGIRDAVSRRLAADARDGGLRDGTVTSEDQSFYLLTQRSTEVDGETLVVMVEITGMQQQRARRATVRAAGLALRDLDRQTVQDLTVADRLKLLEDRIIRCVHEELAFDNFEVRLLDRATRQLVLVIAENLSPLKIGEVIQADEADNGISGWVAATGQSYICRDASDDPRYRDGLDDAGSSLTVPLKQHDQVIGVLNVESLTRDAFDQDDLELAEIVAHYIADAVHMLDLLVVERFTTREQATRSVLEELNEPFDELSEVARALRNCQSDDETLMPIADRLVQATLSMRSRLEACINGPRSILDAEHEIKRLSRDEKLADLHIVVTDDEPRIREEMFRLLAQVGCRVSICEDGKSTIEMFKQLHQSNTHIDLVITDIKLPDLNGYEVFSGAREYFPGLPVILMTGFGYDPSHSIVRASQEGVAAVLFKPFRTAQLLDTVRTVLLGGITTRRD